MQNIYADCTIADMQTASKNDRGKKYKQIIWEKTDSK